MLPTARDALGTNLDMILYFNKTSDYRRCPYVILRQAFIHHRSDPQQSPATTRLVAKLTGDRGGWGLIPD